MRILFIQLPLIDHAYGYVYGNIEYASASISGFIRNKFSKSVETIQLPFVLTCFGSDSLISRYILKTDPDMICFTCYLWNIERNMNIAREIKKANRKIKIIFGGPEINLGSISLIKKRGYVDYFVAGEGEWFFKHLLSDKNMDRYLHVENGNRIFTQPMNELIPATEIFEPYSGMMLDTMIDGSIYLELTRGCPYRCSYCFYSKNCNSVRELPFKLLTDAIKHRKNINEIYILSPTFNTTEDFTEKLKVLARINSGIKLHSEMRAAGIDEHSAGLLYDAGFRSMEVGLQTLNSESLRHVGRNSSPDMELKGMEAMKNAGIDLKIGIIPGLPGDTPEGFIATIERLIELGFGEEIEFYPLMILPGTTIMDHAVSDGVDFLHRPPYYYHNGWGISFEDIGHIREYVERNTGYSMCVKGLPNFTSGEQGLFFAGARFDGDEIKYWEPDLYCGIIETNVFNFHISITDTANISKGLSLLLQGLPISELYNIVFYCDKILEESRIIEFLISNERDNFYRRLNAFNEWSDGLRFRFYQVQLDLDIFMKCNSLYSLIEPVFQVNSENSKAFGIIKDSVNVLVSNGSFPIVKENIIERYSEAPELVAFENEDEQSEFYRLIGYEHIELPYSFKIFSMEGDSK